MIARLFGRSNTYKFKIEIFGDIKTFDFLEVHHHEDSGVLCQVINITRDGERLLGDCKVIGFRKNRVLTNIRTPFQNDAEIKIAEDSFIESTIGLNTDNNDYLGILEHHPNLKISLDLKKMITKHIAVLAKSGAGKSYTVGVILEEVMKKNIPIVILDPHNEYASIKYPNTNKSDMKRLEKLGLKPQGFLNSVKEYSPDTTVNPQSESITLDINKMKPQDLIESLPQKLTPAQQGMVFNILSTVNNRVNIDELIFNISNEESNSKWSLISLLETFKKLKVYSTNPTPLQEIVKYKQTSIISLKGVEPYVQDTFVTGLLKELFEARKREEIPPFLLVLEEAHNFCPEKGMGGELKSTKIIRTLAGEGRKFGVGLCVISQRPAKVDKNVISQCSTQILLKITNPNDLKSVIASSEGVDHDSENEIQKLNIGTCLLTGVIDIPLKVNVRPRISKHGGETVDITMPYETNGNSNNSNQEPQISYNGQAEQTPSELADQIREQNRQERNNNIQDNNQNIRGMPTQKREAKPKASTPKKAAHTEFLQYVAPEIEAEDAKIMLDTNEVATELIPACIIKLKDKVGQESTLLFDKTHKKIIKTLFPFEGFDVKETILTLTPSEKQLIKTIITLKEEFNAAELLIKTDMMFNQILRVCDSLHSKGILSKNGQMYVQNDIKHFKELNKFNFYGNQKFEELSYDKKDVENINNTQIKEIFSLFGTVENIKDVFMVRYVGK